MRNLVGIVLIVVCSLLTSSASTKIDSLKKVLDTTNSESIRVQTLLELTNSLANNDPGESLIYAKRALPLAQKLEDKDLIGDSYSKLAYAYFVQNKLDSFRITLNQSISFYNENDLEYKVARVYRNLAKIGEATNEPDSSIYYLDKCLKVLEEYPDSATLGDVHLSKGFAYRTLGYYNLSLEELFRSLEIFEALDSERRLSYVYQNVGITNAMMDRFPEAIEFSRKARLIFSKQNNLRALAQTENNIGKMYSLMGGDLDSSRVMHRSSLHWAKETGQNWVIKQNYWNLGRLEFDAGRLDSAEYWLSKAYEMADESDDNFMKGGVLRYESRMALQRNNNNLSRSIVNNSLVYMDTYNDPNMIQEASEEYALIFEDLGDYEKALLYKNKAQSIQDSLYTLKKDKQIAELNLIYETEKKNHSIKELEQQTAIDKARKRLLWISLIAALIIGVGVVTNVINKRKKDKILFEKEKELEITKRKNVELELEMKQKELTAKVLQLAKKNEFLLSLESEINKLKSYDSPEIHKTTHRMRRMINFQTNEDEEWEQFSKSFTSVHENFIQGLISKHGKLTKSELRLIALLKMNLSSKDIANTLRISDEGIKKARYRLRKKLELESETSLQQYILAFN